MAQAKSFDTEFVVEAPIERVWAILSDVNNWHRWNRFPFRVRGPLVPGARMWIGPGRRGLVPMPPAVWQIIEPERELRWGGGVRGLIDVSHGLTLEPVDDGKRVLVRHGERIEGALAALVPTAVGPIWRAGLGNINKGLTAYSERGARR